MVGYECDGCATDRATHKPTGVDGTPTGFVVVAQALSADGGPGSQWGDEFSSSIPSMELFDVRRPRFAVVVLMSPLYMCLLSLCCCPLSTCAFSRGTVVFSPQCAFCCGTSRMSPPSAVAHLQGEATAMAIESGVITADPAFVHTGYPTLGYYEIGPPPPAPSTVKLV